MENPIEISSDRYQADEGYIYATDPKLRFDQRRLASLVGYVAIGLPIILGVGGIALGEFRPSLSGFYYERILLGDVFVGSLVFIGTAMFASRGWSRKVADLATIAGLCAYLVALSPAAGWLVGEENTRIYQTATNIVHAAAAMVLFLVLAFFAFFVFTKVEPHQTGSDGEYLRAKLIRNRIYRTTGTLILLALAMIAAGNELFPEWAKAHRVTYWAEAVALVAFGVSWLVQGRVSGKLMRDPRDRVDTQVAAT